MLIYVAEDGLTKVSAKFDNDTVWLSLAQIARLFDRDKSTVSRHIKNIFADGELSESMVVAKFATTTQHGAIRGKTQQHEVCFYNLDMIIAVGCRIKSQRGIQFRQWAAQILKEYMRKGFVLDDERLKGNGGGTYWKELLERIRDIRSSEKMLYRQVLDLYATSADYNPHSEESAEFFKIVQNKLHYAAHGHTAPEVIFERADASKPFMGLKTFSGSMPVLRDTRVAKNYLDETELKLLNNLVSGYFDIAEVNAIEHKPMYMRDYIAQLDAVLSSGGRKLLDNAGKVSSRQALEKAEKEYRKYQTETISSVEAEYLRAMEEAVQTVKKKLKKTR